MSPRGTGLNAIVIVGFGLLVAGVAFSIVREDLSLDPVPVERPASDLVLEWACPSGTVGQVTCGYVEVPANYADTDIEKVRVFIASIQAPLEPSGPPLVFLGDSLGPGTVSDLADWRQIGRELNREIILIDHRGTGLSDPQVNCLDLAKVGWLEVDLGSGEALTAARQSRRDALETCSDRLENLPGNPDFSFDTLIQDLSNVRTALNIDTWLIVGSGDTVPLAVALEHRDPRAAEGLILLRASRPDSDPFRQRIEYAREALQAGFGCHSTVCADSTLVPLDRLVADLGQRSLVFASTVGTRRQPVSVNSGSLLPSLALSAVEQQNRDAMPTVVERLRNGRWREAANLRAQRFPTHDHQALAVRLAVSCEVPTGGLAAPGPLAFTDADLGWLGVLDDPLIDGGLCRPTGAATQAMSRAPGSPVLIINQAFDYLAPATAAGELGRSWPNAITRVLEQGGAPALTDSCVLAVVGDFLDVPITLEAGCD